MISLEDIHLHFVIPYWDSFVVMLIDKMQFGDPAKS